MPDETGTPVCGVDFYVLKSPSPQAVLRLACRVVERAWNNGFRIFLMGRDDAQCGTLDDLLWTFSQGSFIPHERNIVNPESHVTIGSNAPKPDEGFSAIVTLHPDPVDRTFHQYRIADIIGADEVEVKQARQRFRHYRELGLEPRTHHI